MSPGSQPLVSIVLPTYKRAHVLPYAIRSVLAQTYSNWELIVVDDNSPDNTAEVVAGFDDARIRYVKNDPNLKLPRALNRGFAMAQGEYLTWTSDDNLFGELALERMVARLRSGDCDLVYADYYLFSEQDAVGRPIAIKHDRLPGTVQLDRGNHIGACFLYTRQVYEAVGEYDPELFLVEDYDFFIRVSKRFRLGHIDEPLYYFRRDEATLYLSRFAEVKASDVLVRYKNDLLDEDGVIDAMVALLLRDVEGLSSPLLRWTHRLVQGRSYRLSLLHRHIAERHVRRRLQSPAHAILHAFRSRSTGFGPARDRLRHLMGEVGRVRYASP